MPNPQRDAGIRAENEACRLLEAALELPEGTVRRRKNEGIHEDIGDLIGIPNTAIQVTRIGAKGWNNYGRIAQRARTKAADCEQQQARRNARHGVVLLRLDGNSHRPAVWRAIITNPQLHALQAGWDTCSLITYQTQGAVIRDFGGVKPERTWLCSPGVLTLWISTLEGWARSWWRAESLAAITQPTTNQGANT